MANEKMIPNQKERDMGKKWILEPREILTRHKVERERKIKIAMAYITDALLENFNGRNTVSISTNALYTNKDCYFDVKTWNVIAQRIRKSGWNVEIKPAKTLQEDTIVLISKSKTAAKSKKT
jgi:hypothetical protein